MGNGRGTIKKYKNARLVEDRDVTAAVGIPPAGTKECREPCGVQGIQKKVYLHFPATEILLGLHRGAATYQLRWMEVRSTALRTPSFTELLSSYKRRRGPVPSPDRPSHSPAALPHDHLGLLLEFQLARLPRPLARGTHLGLAHDLKMLTHNTKLERFVGTHTEGHESLGKSFSASLRKTFIADSPSERRQSIALSLQNPRCAWGAEGGGGYARQTDAQHQAEDPTGTLTLATSSSCGYSTSIENIKNQG